MERKWATRYGGPLVMQIRYRMEQINFKIMPIVEPTLSTRLHVAHDKDQRPSAGYVMEDTRLHKGIVL
jgi:hypothetical protein